MTLTGEIEVLDAWLAKVRVLLIDDEPANLQFLRHVLATEGYGELIAISDSADAMERFQELDPDLVITDLLMPHLDGFEVITRIGRMLAPGVYLPIVAATGDHAPETRRRALSAGARDFLTKPLSPAEVRLRVRNLLETRFLHEQLRGHNLTLEGRVAERTSELEEARTEILLRLARAAEFRDDQTGEHTVRVGKLSARLAQVLGLPGDVADLIGRAAPLHDIGKIGIPDGILLKPDRLETAEFETMKAHAEIGAKILSGSRYPLLQLAEEIALTHHERWDGGGYPHQLTGEDIPLTGRIVAVADVFDSLTHARPYKHAWTVRDTIIDMTRNSGRHFDPAVIEALLRIVPELHVLGEAAFVPAQLIVESVPAAFAPAGPPSPPDELNALADRVLAVEAERDELTRQLRQLRRQIAKRETEAAAWASSRRLA
ncbi:MAG: HD domain-containing phosphohydrolase [Gemmatimonadota bacterium]